MTVLNDVLLSATGAAKQVLIESTEKGYPLFPTILVFRGNEQIAIIQVQRGSRDDMLAVASAAAYTLEPDQLAIVHDTWCALVQPNPRTGKPYREGELGELAERYDGREKGWVADAIMVFACNKAGDRIAEIVPYRVRGGAIYRKVEWLPKPPLPDGIREEELDFGGIIPNALDEIMNRPSISHDMAGSEAGRAVMVSLGAEAVRAHQDCAAVKTFASPPPSWGTDFPRDLTIMLSAEPGTDRLRIIEESLGSEFL